MRPSAAVCCFGLPDCRHLHVDLLRPARLLCCIPQAVSAKLNGNAHDAAEAHLAAAEKRAAAQEAELIRERNALSGQVAALRLQVSDLQQKVAEAKVGGEICQATAGPRIGLTR